MVRFEIYNNSNIYTIIVDICVHEGKRLNYQVKIFYTINEEVVSLNLWGGEVDFRHILLFLIYLLLGGSMSRAIWFAERGEITSQNPGVFCWLQFFVGITFHTKKTIQRWCN